MSKYPTLEAIAKMCARIKEERELRIATGMWLRVTELRLRDHDSLPAFMEHCERSPDPHIQSMPGSSWLMGIPVIYDETVPPSTARLTFEDGSTSDHSLI
jgi:hypothetical protein